MMDIVDRLKAMGGYLDYDCEVTLSSIADEIQTLRAKVESEKLVSNMQSVLIDDFKIRNSELVEALREITNIANAPSFHYRNMAQKALATYDKLSEVK